jgi:hypothetical protein
MMDQTSFALFSLASRHLRARWYSNSHHASSNGSISISIHVSANAVIPTKNRIRDLPIRYQLTKPAKTNEMSLWPAAHAAKRIVISGSIEPW